MNQSIFGHGGRQCSMIVALSTMVLVTWISIVPASAQGVFARAVQEIYDGKPADELGIRLGSWGSGLCEESTENTSAGSRSLKITPRDLYAGGRIDFTVPLDVSPSLKTPDVYLQLMCQFFGRQAADQLSQALGTAAAPTDVTASTPTGKPVKTVRLVVFFENGPAVDIQAPVSAYRVGEDGWMPVCFPMSLLKGKAELPQYRITRIAISGDGTEPFYIGEIRTVPDSAPLVAEAGEDMEVSKNYAIGFQGFCQAGASAVQYSWDFDKRDGVQAEALGDLVYHSFTRAGTYQVTLTCTDLFGIKEPSSKTIYVKVNE